MATTAPAASCIGAEHGCVMFDCLVHLWDWIDPPMAQTPLNMENKNTYPATQQPLVQQHVMAHHVHPNEQIYSPQHTPMVTQLTSPQPQLQANGVMHQLLQNQYQSNMDARSPLLENRQDLYGSSNINDYSRHYGANDNYNYPQSPQRAEVQPDHNVNHELLQNIPKGYNAEVYQDYLKRNPPKDLNQIYQNHQPTYRPNVMQSSSKPYQPYPNRNTPQSNTELLRRQYNEIQQMKLQQQMHYQSQAQIQQQQTFAERQLLLQQLHGVQPPPNLQQSIYSDGSYRDLDRYDSRNDFKDQCNSPDIQKEVDRYIKNNEYKDVEKQNRNYQPSQYQTHQQLDYRDADYYRSKQENEITKMSSSPPDFPRHQAQKNNVGVVSPMKSSESSSPSVKSPSSDSRRSSGGHQALRSPIAQRISSAPVTMSGVLYKQGSDGLKVWRKRWFVLSEYCLFYYKSNDEEKLLGSVLLPSYRVSACTHEDRVMRKFAFKLEHTNMRTYILAAPDQDSMMKWVKVLTMAALMQNNLEQPHKSDRTATKVEDDDEIPGPTYANAPPKPRRSNDGYNSPSPEMYDPNYDILKKPASHYSQDTSHTRYQEHSTHQTNPNSETIYNRKPQSPIPPHSQQYQTKRNYDTHNLSLPLTNTMPDKLENTQCNAPVYNNSQSLYFDNRTKRQPPPHAMSQENNVQDKIYERQSTQNNPFLQHPPTASVDKNTNDRIQVNALNKNASEYDIKRFQSHQQSNVLSTGNSNIETSFHNRDNYGELNTRQRANNITTNERLLIERRTPDAYGRSASGQDRTIVGDYEDVYPSYGLDNEYGRPQSKPESSQEHVVNYNQAQSFSGPAILRRKKMQSSGIQPPVPRPHSADFLEYESRTNTLNKTMPKRSTYDLPRQPQRPKSSLDINSSYDPSSDRYYSEESYAAKMRQSAQYLQRDKMGSKNIQIPLEKYASGLAEKQLLSPFAQSTNNNYETEFSVNRNNKDNLSLNYKYDDNDGLNSNWTLKEKAANNQRDNLNRSGSILSDSSNIIGLVKDKQRFDPTINDGFTRSVSARLPSTVMEKDGDKKVQQREESMKRLLEWKQRMLQSPLTRKSTPATISLARSLNQNRNSAKSSDQYKNKNYATMSYNSYSSDDEEQTTSTDLQNSRTMQAGRSQRENMPSSYDTPAPTPHEPPLSIVKSDFTSNQENKIVSNKSDNIMSEVKIYENIEDENVVVDNKGNKAINDYVIVKNNDVSKVNNHDCDSNDSEAESEKQHEYTDDDLDEVLLIANEKNESILEIDNGDPKKVKTDNGMKPYFEDKEKIETPPATPITSSEDHYLPMSPRKLSKIEPPHQTIINNLSVFDKTLTHVNEDNPYVEMNLGSEDDDLQNYEVVCVNNGQVEPVYMELNNVSDHGDANDENQYLNTKSSPDSASNFADTKQHTLKRVPKAAKIQQKIKEDNEGAIKGILRSDCSDADDEASKDISLETPFNRLSISDTFRPASYYLRTSRNILDVQDSSDSEIISPLPASCSPLPTEDLTNEALSKYVLDKLDKSNISQDNSILKMLTCESQMNTVKRKTTSLMIYGSKTSIYDTLTRGEKIRHSRASISNVKSRLNDVQTDLLSTSLHEHYNSNRSIETDSLMSYNADRDSSRLSLDSDISSKFEMTPSNISSEVTSLNESDNAIELRSVSGYRDIDMMNKRRPLSDDSFFDLDAQETSINNNLETGINIDLDMYLNNLQSKPLLQQSNIDNMEITGTDSTYNTLRSQILMDRSTVITTPMPSISHIRCSSTPAAQTSSFKFDSSNKSIERQYFDQQSGYTGSQSSCSSVGVNKSPMSYYTKEYDLQKSMNKNINTDIISDKIKELENEDPTLIGCVDTNTSSNTTGFHSRESSAEHSAPYYYSDLSSQEHLNLLPTTHYLKNTNLHRKLNNQRRRGPLNKKNEISHIHNPIHNTSMFINNSSCDLAAATRSISVEFLCAADKDPEIDMKNIYESTTITDSKIPESMSTSLSFGCKRNSSNSCINSSPENETNSRRCSAPVPQLSEDNIKKHSSPKQFNISQDNAERAYENVLCQGEKLWDEDSLWRDNLRRVSHRHTRSMDDLDALPDEACSSGLTSVNVCGLNSLKNIKKIKNKKLSRNVTYVNTDIQGRVLNRLENCSTDKLDTSVKVVDDDVYVSLAENSDLVQEQSDEGVYEQLSIDAAENASKDLNVPEQVNDCETNNKRKFEIDREKLRQWDLMSSGLIKSGVGFMRGSGVKEALCSVDSGADSASNEASVTVPAPNPDEYINNSLQQALSKKAFLGSNTSIGRLNRDANIPVRAVSPRVRWVEEKPPHDNFGSQQMSSSYLNLNNLSVIGDSWTVIRPPSRVSQQPIRAVSPRVRRNTENDEMTGDQGSQQNIPGFGVHGQIPTAGELLGRTHEELVLLLIQLRRRHAATHRAMDYCCAHISSIEEGMGSINALEREENLQRLEQLKAQLMELEHQYQKSKPLVQLVDNMVKLGSLYNKPGTNTMERLEKNQRLRQKVLAEHAMEQQRWLENAAAGKPLETEAARARVAELWALEQELADEAGILQGMKTDKDAIESLLTGVRRSFNKVHTDTHSQGREHLEAELYRVQEMLAHNTKKLQQTVADNARLERELVQLRRALHSQRQSAAPTNAPGSATAQLEDEVSRVQQLVSALQKQRQELSRAVGHLTQQSRELQMTQLAMPESNKRHSYSYWQETNLDTGHTIDHNNSGYDYDINGAVLSPGQYESAQYQMPLYVETQESGVGSMSVTSPMTGEDIPNTVFGNLTNAEKQEIKTVRIVKRESERRHRDRERSLQPMADWSSNNLTTNIDQYLEEELITPTSNYTRANSVPRTDFSKFEEYYSTPQNNAQHYSSAAKDMTSSMEMSPKYPSSPSLSNYDFSREISSLGSSYNKGYSSSGYDRTVSLSTQYLNSPTDSARTLTNDPLSKTSSIGSLTRSHIELSPIFKSEAAKQIITEMSGDNMKHSSLHRRQVPKEKRRHYTAPHHLSAKTLNEMPIDIYNQEKMGRSLDDADMERALRAPPDVVRSAIAPQRYGENTIDQLLLAPQKIVIPERYIPEKPPELSPEEQQKRQEKVESIKKMLSSSSADPNKSPDGEEKRQRNHLLQMNQILAKQVMEMSKIVAVKALEELPQHYDPNDLDDRSPDVELPIYQQRDNFFT